MSEVINLEDSFEDWFHAVESSGLKSERFYEHINYCRTREAQAELILTWIKAAYMQGIKTAAQDSVRTLDEYATSLEGCTDFEYYPSQAYDTASDSLNQYWNNIFKDTK